MMKCVRPWQVVLLISVAYVLLTLARYNFDPKIFALIGTQYDPGLPAGQPGYDGQFAYQIARDPLNGWTKVDVPAYRYQRIVYPMAARVLALGNADLVPWTLIILNVLALAVGVWLMEEILRHFNVSRWYALIYGLSAGTLMSVRLDLTEPLAYALAQAGVLLGFERSLALGGRGFGAGRFNQRNDAGGGGGPWSGVSLPAAVDEAADIQRDSIDAFCDLADGVVAMVRAARHWIGRGHGDAVRDRAVARPVVAGLAGCARLSAVGGDRDPVGRAPGIVQSVGCQPASVAARD
jgi:hypothetical protein